MGELKRGQDRPLRVQPPSRPDAPPVPIGPDPARDARIAARRSQEQRRAARALDRYLQVTYGYTSESVKLVAGERFVEALGDYVLSRIPQKSHYDVAQIQAAVESVLGPSAGRDVVEALVGEGVGDSRANEVTGELLRDDGA